MVDELRRRGPERLEQPPVQRLVRPMIVAADNVRDAAVRVVDDHRELIGKHSVGALDDEIADVAREMLLLQPLQPIAKSQGRFIDANTPIPQAQSMLSNNRLGRAIVLDSNGLIVGYVSLRDVSKARSEPDRR